MEAEEILVRLLSRWYKRSVTIGVRATLCVVLLLRILTKHVRTYNTYAHMLAWLFNNHGGGGGGGGDGDLLTMRMGLREGWRENILNTTYNNCHLGDKNETAR